MNRQVNLIAHTVLGRCKHGIVGFPNFAQWRLRKGLFFGGRAPKSPALPFEWYNTPNIHFCTVQDFEALCRERGIRILARDFVGNTQRIDIAPTILELARAEPFPDIAGSSLVPLLEEGESKRRDVAISELTIPRKKLHRRVIRSGDWKLLVDFESGETVGFWNLAEDPEEKVNLIRMGHELDDEVRGVISDESVLRMARRAVSGVSPSKVKVLMSSPRSVTMPCTSCIWSWLSALVGNRYRARDCSFFRMLSRTGRL